MDEYIRMGKNSNHSAVDVEWLDEEFLDTSGVRVAELLNNSEEQITIITTDEHLCSPWTELQCSLDHALLSEVSNSGY